MNHLRIRDTEVCKYDVVGEIKQTESRVPVAHTCNASYSGGREQEDLSSKPAPGQMTNLEKKTHHKIGLVE
jgi:hypothetical protein